MTFSKLVFWCIIGLTLTSAASAQVYESKDAQGNTVFSDRPSEGAEVIEVAPTNSADPAPDIPAAPRQSTTAEEPGRTATPAAAPRQGQDDDYIYYGGNTGNNASAREERREEIKERREEGAGKPGREPPIQAKPHRAGGGGRR
jgi:Domain of unknown function (DUF4124)